MRDESLFYLFSSVNRVKGVGSATVEALQRLLPTATAMSGNTAPIVRDLLFHLPVNMIDRSFTCPLTQAPDGVVATFIVTVDAHYPPLNSRWGSKKPYKIECSNESGTLTLVFFHASNDYLKQTLPVGTKRVISGRTEHFDMRLQMTHPDIIAPVDKLTDVQKPEAVYPLTVGLTSKKIVKMVETAMEKLPVLPEWIDLKFPPPLRGEVREGGGAHPIPQGMGELLPSWKSALQSAHHPKIPDDLLPTSPDRMRLAYDEILANQLHLAMLRRNMQHQSGANITGTGKLTGPLIASLPFTLTQGQQDVLQDIFTDMQSGKRMGRLLQGDVGSGKTIIALIAMLRALEHGLQTALMVPTEIIALQH